MKLSRAGQVGRFAAVVRYFRDKDASFFGKGLVFLALFYVVMPFDVVPEAFLPVLGWLDDIGVMALALGHLARVTAKYRALPPPAET